MNATKKSQIIYIANKISSLNKNWSDCSDDDSYKAIFAVSPYSVKDYFYPSFDDIRSGKFDFMKELSNNYDLFDFILKNRKHLCFSERYHSNSQYDCSGSCIGSGINIRKIDDYTFIIIRTATFDV